MKPAIIQHCKECVFFELNTKNTSTTMNGLCRVNAPQVVVVGGSMGGGMVKTLFPVVLANGRGCGQGITHVEWNADHIA